MLVSGTRPGYACHTRTSPQPEQMLIGGRTVGIVHPIKPLESVSFGFSYLGGLVQVDYDGLSAEKLPPTVLRAPYL